ncbi:MAG: hypothetical protein U0892_08165 [Pirellulales bacterium]
MTESRVLAQESVPNEAAKSASTVPDNSGPSTPITPDAASKMPDITGTWQVKTIEPADSKNTFFTWEIRRVQQGEVDFLVDLPWAKEPHRLTVKWSAMRQRFEGEYKDDASVTENYSFTLQPQADRNSLLVITTSSNKTEGYVTQIWKRTSMTLATSYSPSDVRQPETPQTESSTRNLVEGANRGAHSTTVNDVALRPSAVPNTPAAKDLLKRLEAQESAAASAANEIRRLQANGDAVETIALHRAQLKAHLQTAFELKMQLEELQVKELQARLSRLERQIVRRKELREKIINRRAGELIDLQSESDSEVSAAATRLIKPNTEIPAQQQTPGSSANAQSQMLDFIRDEAYSHVEDISSLQYAFHVKDDNGWHAEAQFFADQTRFRVNRKDLAGMQVKGERIDPITSASAFDGLRQQYLDTNGRLRLKNGCEGASYGIGTPHVDVYSWLRRGPEDLRWDIICNQDLWKERFAEAEYIGAISENGRTLEIVDFPARLEGQKPCTYRVFFARDLRFFPIKCFRRVSATTETSTTVTVTDFKSIEKDGMTIILPTTLTYSESHADGVSMKQQRTTTVAVNSLKVNEPIDEAVFTIDNKEAKEVLSVQDQASIGTQSESPHPPIENAATYTPAPGIEAIAIGLDASATAIKNMSVTTDYKKRHVYGLPFDAPIELTLVTKTIIDSEGRLRVETTGQQINIEPDGKSARAYNGRWETVFQNGEARSLTWYESNPPTASIDNTPSLHGIHPREFTTHFQSKPVSEIIRTSSAEIAERVMWDDRPVTIVQTTPIQNAKDARRYRFWIDQERNVLVRRAIAIRFAEGQPWQEYARIENHDYQQVSPAIWLPNKVKYESLEVTPELTPAKLSWSYEGTNRDWKVNNELPADTFELAFPEGTFVNDHRASGIEAVDAAADEGLRKK